MKPLRRNAILFCLAAATICLIYAYFRPHLSGWLRSNGGGVPYVMFWIFFVFSMLPYKRLINRICIVVVLLVCGIEFLQLWNPPALASFRKTGFGAALLGSKFVWMDFPPYFIGGVAGWFCLRLAIRSENLMNNKIHE